MNDNHHYWTFNLDPHIFQFKNIPFDWVTTWLGIAILILLFGGGILLTRTQLLRHKFNFFLKKILWYSFFLFIILFTLQKFNVPQGPQWYGMGLIGGFSSIYLGCLYWINKKELMLTKDSLLYLIIYVVIGVFVGARLFYVFVYNWNYYQHNLSKIFAIWQGGLSFHGGIIGVVAATLFFTKAYKIPFYHVTDKCVRLIPIGIGLGRFGNFMNGELWGREIAGFVPWAIIFPKSGSLIPRHPNQLYESLMEGVLLFITLYILSRRLYREGTMSSFFLIFYCIYRFCIEYFREADVQVSYFYLNNMTWGSLAEFPQAQWWQVVTMGQFLCSVGLSIGVIIWVFITSKQYIIEGSPEWLKRNEDFFHDALKNKGKFYEMVGMGRS